MYQCSSIAMMMIMIIEWPKTRSAMSVCAVLARSCIARWPSPNTLAFTKQANEPGSGHCGQCSGWFLFNFHSFIHQFLVVMDLLVATITTRLQGLRCSPRCCTRPISPFTYTGHLMAMTTGRMLENSTTFLINSYLEKIVSKL